jgi:hypothetical protein
VLRKLFASPVDGLFIEFARIFLDQALIHCQEAVLRESRPLSAPRRVGQSRVQALRNERQIPQAVHCVVA